MEIFNVVCVEICLVIYYFIIFKIKNEMEFKLVEKKNCVSWNLGKDREFFRFFWLNWEFVLLVYEYVVFSSLRSWLDMGWSFVLKKLGFLGRF